VSRPASIEDLRSISYFESLTGDEARRFAAELSARTYGPRETIVAEDEPSRGFYFLRSGKARIFRTGTDGREQTFRLVEPGDTFGEVPVFDGQPAPATVETLEPSEVVFLPAPVFLQLLQRQPTVATAVLRHFARRLRSFTELVEQISLQTVQSRLARYLYQLAREEGVPSPEGTVVPREITQQDLASLVGSVREVVSRTLRVMEEDGIVEVRRREIVIRDLPALQRLL
jgi:CRP/FNR family transcriptional regulator